MKCYQLIGGLLTRFGLDAEQQLSIAFAPTFWKLLLCDEPTLEEFALEDITLANRLLKLRKGADESDPGTPWPTDVTWSFTDYNGDIQAIEDPLPANAPAGSR